MKDGIHDCVVNGNMAAVNLECRGPKSPPNGRYQFAAGGRRDAEGPVDANGPRQLEDAYGVGADPFGPHFDKVLEQRRQEADQFYAGVIPSSLVPMWHESCAKPSRDVVVQTILL